mmetsp:Transcript_4114/g.14517  ORF Transcript_4114/g.14517 Transcript_4114/m.14517 type:complete len:747 (+) Transcript_4114:43-2283(+)|eukprot:CAMPEP_0114627878 /NCGR_PEP_ID=MMETSP0168-20121206/12528_1 /TAXON_ID=95228 ORGANISM="Vannella sp., Strain DIVA3 517/6/12" /NCGR_SAMPLE_ID=MMETSP0168 /ASSEMBLY_ACC=CAM_ASM_000044 /LENGTH=746 /DNA_ID=CAMNT_0001839235 /DNA_START=8 /DNA_END=2248 /DNA_ORIENTATION=+
MSTEAERMLLSSHRRIVVKVGTSVVSHANGVLALGRLGHIVEDIAKLVWAGKQILLVSSGSIGVGRTKLLHQSRMSATFREHMHGNVSTASTSSQACAAAGQSGLMGFYDLLFGHHDLSCAQVLLTADDLDDQQRAAQMQSTLNGLLEMRVVPIVNENDVLSTHNVGERREGVAFWDNDSLASLIATRLQADLLVLLTDVKGVYKQRPIEVTMEDRDRTLDPPPIPHLNDEEALDLSGKSVNGRGGMVWKVHAARAALRGGVRHVVIASGYTPSTLHRVASGAVEGTLLGPIVTSTCASGGVEALAAAARAAARALPALPLEKRRAALRAIAKALRNTSKEIMVANEADLANALSNDMSKEDPLYKRLVLTGAKLETLAAGIEQIAAAPDPLGRVLRRMEVADGVRLAQVTAPVGVLLVIFESRPDVLPQIASLAVAAGCGLVLKGGKEATQTNKVLLSLVEAAVHEQTGVEKAVQLLRGREDVKSLLKLPHAVDLVIPRGSRALVEATRRMTSVPVLGHADGICHVFLHRDAEPAEAVRIAVDAKVDYPAACNAAETILVDRPLLDGPVFGQLLKALARKRVECFAGPALVATGAADDLEPAKCLSHEYGALAVTLEVVENVEGAIEHINQYGSSHTDTILTENAEAAATFMRQVDSACVFHNASTRFADGYRFGLGAEVGISTGRIHARGPVGVDGLLSSKWVMDAAPGAGVVGDYSSGSRAYTHVPMDEATTFPTDILSAPSE